MSTDARIEGLSLDARVKSLSNTEIDNALLINTLALGDGTYIGTGVGVAIVDSGFDPKAEQDFSGKIAFYDFTTGKTNPPSSTFYDKYRTRNARRGIDRELRGRVEGLV